MVNNSFITMPIFGISYIDSVSGDTISDFPVEVVQSLTERSERPNFCQDLKIKT